MSEKRNRRATRHTNSNSSSIQYSKFVANPHYVSIKDGVEGDPLRSFLLKAKAEKEECQISYPSFDFAKEIANEEFRNLLDSGHTMKSAYETLHPEINDNMAQHNISNYWIKRNLISVILFVVLLVSIIVNDEYFGAIALLAFFVRILYANPLDLNNTQERTKEINPFYMIAKSFLFLMAALFVWHLLFNQ